MTDPRSMCHWNGTGINESARGTRSNQPPDQSEYQEVPMPKVQADTIRPLACGHLCHVFYKFSSYLSCAPSCRRASSFSCSYPCRRCGHRVCAACASLTWSGRIHHHLFPSEHNYDSGFFCDDGNQPYPSSFDAKNPDPCGFGGDAHLYLDCLPSDCVCVCSCCRHRRGRQLLYPLASPQIVLPSPEAYLSVIRLSYHVHCSHALSSLVGIAIWIRVVLT
mmetsp:Transcript_33978/g.74524  ORF Transcript_33978/g.74524 Transcript_33978/m.74524 type:complete len:220 (+) Transcript_33978:812-1471(+)